MIDWFVTNVTNRGAARFARLVEDYTPINEAVCSNEKQRPRISDGDLQPMTCMREPAYTYTFRLTSRWRAQSTADRSPRCDRSEHDIWRTDDVLSDHLQHID